MPPGLILESIVALLLLVTVIFCVRLERKLSALRSGQDGLKEIIGALNTATIRAQTSVAELRAAADAVGVELGERVGRARTIADELGILVETADGLADRLSGSGKAGTVGKALTPIRANDSGNSTNGWEQALLKALREAR